jgi:hypothetical protein
MSAIHLISTQNVFWPNNIVHSLLTTSRHMDKTDVRKAWARQVLHLDRKQKPLAGAEPRWGRKQTLSRGLPDAALLAWVRPSTRTSPPSLQVYRRQGIRLVNSDTSLANLGRVMDDGRRLWTWLATWPESCSVHDLAGLRRCRRRRRRRAGSMNWERQPETDRQTVRK